MITIKYPIAGINVFDKLYFMMDSIDNNFDIDPPVNKTIYNKTWSALRDIDFHNKEIIHNYTKNVLYHKPKQYENR